MYPRLTRAIKVLLIVNFVAFVLQQTADQFFGAHWVRVLGLVPEAFFRGYFWQPITYLFIHHDVMQLFFNLMTLAFIGGELESAWGTRRFLKFYFFCGLSAAFVYLILGKFFVPSAAYTPLMGASSALYGLLVAYGLIFGERVLLFMMLFPMKAKYFVAVLGLLELLTTAYSGGSGVTSLVHLTGMLAGFGYLWGRATWVIAWKRHETRSAEKARMKKRRAQHLKLVINNDRDPGVSDDESGDEPKTWH